MTAQQYWLIKSEPESYGIRHLKADKKTPWTGVRNFQARNFMQAMRVGDPVLYYHSNCAEPGMYGLAKVVSKPYPDPSQFDANGNYFDKRSTEDKPIWYLVDVAFVKEFKKPVLLAQLRDTSVIAAMMILQRGSRLSVTPVDERHFEKILSLAE